MLLNIFLDLHQQIIIVSKKHVIKHVLQENSTYLCIVIKGREVANLTKHINNIKVIR